MISSTLVKIAAAEEAEKEPQEYYPRCSVAGPERCKRAQTYWALGYPRNPFPGRFVILLQDSTFHEELTADWIRKSAFTLHSEQMGLDCDVLPFGTDKPRFCKLCEKEIAGNIVHGHTDGIITDILMNDSIWEHKALNHFTFEMYWKGDKYPLDYITQGCLYKKGVSKVNPHVKNICLNIKNKNTSQMIDYVIEYDIETDIAKVVEVEHSNGKKKYPDFVYENVIAIARQRFIEIEDFRSRNELPEREFDREEWQCDYCFYGEKCWEGYEQEFNTMTEDATLEGSIIELCSFYLEQVNYEKDAKSHKEELNAKIKDILRSQNIRKGKTGQGNPGDYTINWRLQHEERIMPKAEIPDDILPRILKQSIKEILTIRKIQAKKEG